LGDKTFCHDRFVCSWRTPDGLRVLFQTMGSLTRRPWHRLRAPIYERLVIVLDRSLPPHRLGEGAIVAKRADGPAIPRYFFGSPTRDVVGDACGNRGFVTWGRCRGLRTHSRSDCQDFVCSNFGYNLSSLPYPRTASRAPKHAPNRKTVRAVKLT
jgi:hypothetical protein